MVPSILIEWCHTVQGHAFVITQVFPLVKKNRLIKKVVKKLIHCKLLSLAASIDVVVVSSLTYQKGASEFTKLWIIRNR